MWGVEEFLLYLTIIGCVRCEQANAENAIFGCPPSNYILGCPAQGLVVPYDQITKILNSGNKVWFVTLLTKMFFRRHGHSCPGRGIVMEEKI